MSTRVVSERRAARWLRGSVRTDGARWSRLRSRWAWRRLSSAARRGDPHVLALLVHTARDHDHPRRDGAGALLADRWVNAREPELRRVVLALGAMASGGLARLRTAALHGRLTEHWHPDEARAVQDLLDDPDPAVQAGAEHACLTAAGVLLEALWRCVDPDPNRFIGPARLVALLLRNPTPAPSDVVDLMWEAWTRTPDERTWGALSAWRTPARFGWLRGASLVAIEPDAARLAGPKTREALLEAARLTDHPLGDIARDKILAANSPELLEAVCDAAIEDDSLVPFCVEHRLAPRDPVRRVEFFLLTGQLDQYRGLDPDGRLLELAYASADPEVRTDLQIAIRAAGAMDLVNLLVSRNRRARIPEMDDGEVTYLAGHLAERGEWTQLWTLVQDLPLPVGVGLMRLFPAWLPADSDSRLLFDRLRRTDPHAAREALNGLRNWWPGILRQARIEFHGRVNAVSFAPDAPALAVAGTNRVAGVVDLTRARLVDRYHGFDSSVGHIVHTGGGAFVAAERSSSRAAPCRLLRCAAGRHTVLHTEPGPITALTLSGTDGSFVAGTRGGDLLLGSPDNAIRTAPVQRLGLSSEQDWPRAVTAHLGSGRLAVLGRSLAVTDADAAQVLARAHGRLAIGRAVFIDPDSLVVAGKSGFVEVLHRFGYELVPGKSRVIDTCGLTTLPGKEEILLVDRNGLISLVDAASLTPKWHGPVPYGATGGDLTATSAHVSPGGEFLAVGYGQGFTDLYDLRAWTLPSLINKPLVACVPSDLGAVAGARTAPDVPSATRPFLDLLHAMLEHRFRFDIELGDVGAISAGEYDISL